MGEQLGRTPHPSQSRPMAQHSQTNIPPRTSNPQSFAHGYLQRTGEDDIQWQEECEEWRTLTPSKGHFCTHPGCGKIFDRDFQLANHIKYDHPEVAVQRQRMPGKFGSLAELNIHRAPQVCRSYRKEFRCEKVLDENNHNCGFAP